MDNNSFPSKTQCVSNLFSCCFISIAIRTIDSMFDFGDIISVNMSGGRLPPRKKSRLGTSSTNVPGPGAAETARVDLDDDASAAKKPRDPNFNPWEDLTLSRTFANAT